MAIHFTVSLYFLLSGSLDQLWLLAFPRTVSFDYPLILRANPYLISAKCLFCLNCPELVCYLRLKNWKIFDRFFKRRCDYYIIWITCINRCCFTNGHMIRKFSVQILILKPLRDELCNLTFIICQFPSLS